MTLIYIGPDVRRAGLRAMTVYSGGYPPTARELLEAHPYARNLFVTPDVLPDSIKAIRRRGTLLNIYYERLKGDTHGL